jgi:hypothetical protein
MRTHAASILVGLTGCAIWMTRRRRMSPSCAARELGSLACARTAAEAVALGPVVPIATDRGRRHQPVVIRAAVAGRRAGRRGGPPPPDCCPVRSWCAHSAPRTRPLSRPRVPGRGERLALPLAGDDRRPTSSSVLRCHAFVGVKLDTDIEHSLGALAFIEAKSPVPRRPSIASIAQ